MSTNLTIGSIIIDNARRFGNVPAYVLDDQILTHRELLTRATAVAASLASSGLRRQDRIAILSRNTIEFGEVLAAAHVCGLVAATVNFRLSAAEMANILLDSAPRVLFFEAEYLPIVQSLRSSLPDIELFICFDPTDDDSIVDYGAFVGAGLGAELPFLADADDVACLVYTSGTTGRPKGCMLGQRELRRVALTMNNEMRSGSTDRALIVMPMFHFGGMCIAMGIHARGGTVVLRKQFEPRETPALIAQEQISILHLAPVMLNALLDSMAAASTLAGVRTVVYAAAPMTPTILAKALIRMPDVGFLNLYGQTEVIISGLPREFHRNETPRDVERLRTVGFPFQETEVRIVDEDGIDAPTGVSGEITVRSSMMFHGYWNDSAATANTIRDGWCRTGDIGILDHEGILRLVDRKKDIIISGGENVSSLEVEDAALTHPAVAECAVVAVADTKWGEIVCAVIVLRSGMQIDLDSLREHVASQVARYKAPRKLVVVDEIPKLPTGKIDKKRIRLQLAPMDAVHTG